MIGPAELVLAFFLDLAIGDPKWLPHPVRIIGRAITHMEALLRSMFGRDREKAAGVILVVLIVLPSALLTYLLCLMLRQPSEGILMIFGKAVLIYLAGTTIALRELVVSAKRVIASVESGILTDARKHLSMIVGRDTESLSDEGVLRATVETLAENLSDGVIAPVFYLVLGGLPLAIAYKAINTLDSMVGYKNEKYIRFGWAAAKLDDVANYIPARITGVLIIVSAYLLGVMSSGRSKTVIGFSGLDSLTIMLRDGRKHTSPNSGMPEAAVAGALGIRLGGPSTYGGRLFEKPFIGDEKNGDYLSSAHKTMTLIGTASALSAAVAVIVLRMRDLA